MSRSHSSWNGSASCRLEWRPSMLQEAMLCLLGLLAVVAILGSALEPPFSVPLSLLVAGYTGRSARSGRRRPPRQLVIPAGESPATLDGLVLERLHVQWRGPLAFLAWQDASGQRGDLVWWPDTLDARQRRELRLAADNAVVSPAVATVAP